jgi:hypothetical protein
MNTSAANTITTAPNHHDEIAQHARDLWSEAGQPQGRDAEFWLEAEHRLLSARQVPDVSACILATLAQPVTRRAAEVKRASGEVAGTRLQNEDKICVRLLNPRGAVRSRKSIFGE